MLSRTILKLQNHRVAVVLSGSGVYDGSEITEAVSTLVHLSASGADVSMYAPDKDQMHVVNHMSGEEMNEKRNVLVESARIARGAVEPLANLNTDSFDALIIPGGFGAAKNLSTFATEGPDMSVDADLSRVLDGFKVASKPIGEGGRGQRDDRYEASYINLYDIVLLTSPSLSRSPTGLCCIAPTIAAKQFGDTGVKLTVGMSSGDEAVWPYAGAAGACEAMGATHTDVDIDGVVVDLDAKVVTSPGEI